LIRLRVVVELKKENNERSEEKEIEKEEKECRR